ncbi:MAG: tyrosine-type recombinase/integrase [Pseudonocardiaceae bacterium]
MDEDVLEGFIGSLKRLRDLAMFLLMLDGGLRPGEALSLHLADVSYGQRRVTVRKRDDHPHGARGKSRTERVVDLHEPRTLDAVSRYVMRERPLEAASPFVFLIGGNGARRLEPLGYDALVRLFSRRMTKLGLRTPETTPHALRHSHATAMWEGGMRELSLQKRLGHASPESTKVYTRVSDEAVLADYTRVLEKNR